MSILPAGSFRVSDYRVGIPAWVKIVCAIRALPPNAPNLSYPAISIIEWVRNLRFDHRPPLCDRPFDDEAGDFIPPQNDPDHIEALPTKEHDARTFGRKPDAELTVTTAGSDTHRRAQTKRIRDREALHELKMEVKRGDPGAIAKLLKVEKKQKPKKKWPSRPFGKRRKKAA